MDFVGRNQKKIEMKKWAGANIPNIELNLAINRDKEEYDCLKTEIEKLNNFVSKDATNIFSIKSVYEKLIYSSERF